MPCGIKKQGPWGGSCPQRTLKSLCSGIVRPDLESGFRCVKAVWPQANCPVCLSLSFLACKMAAARIPSPQAVVRAGRVLAVGCSAQVSLDAGREQKQEPPLF